MTLEDGPPDDAENIAVGNRKPPRVTRLQRAGAAILPVALGGVIAKRPMRPF